MMQPDNLDFSTHKELKQHKLSIPFQPQSILFFAVLPEKRGIVSSRYQDPWDFRN